MEDDNVETRGMATELAQTVGGKKIAFLIAILAAFAIIASLGNRLSEEDGESPQHEVQTQTDKAPQTASSEEGLTSGEKRFLGVLWTIAGLAIIFGIVLPLSLEYRKYRKGKRLHSEITRRH